MTIDTILMPHYPTFMYDDVGGKIEKKVFPSLQEAEDYIDTLNNQGFTHWIFPKANVDTAGILECTSRNTR